MNIREHCAWVCNSLKEATDKAKLMIAAAIEKARSLGKEKVLKVKRKEAILVIGGGPAGIQASLELANQGFKVYLVESSPTIGGLASSLHRTFSINECNCAICVKSSKPLEVYENPNIELLTYCETSDVKRYPWGFKVKIIKKPKYVNYDRCTNCGLCSEKCPQLVLNEWDRGLSKRKAIYIPLPYATPPRYVIDPNHCLHFTENSCNICEEVCPYNAIDFSQKAEEVEVEVGAIIVATGSEEFNPSTIPKYGYGKCKDVITQLQLERLMDPLGPTGGRLVRVSDGEKPSKIVMIQCVGSRDPKINPYCSSICCSIALKHARSIKERHPEIDVTIVYKDIRLMGKYDEKYLMECERLGVNFVKGEVIDVKWDPELKRFRIKLESFGERKCLLADLIVLSTGFIPSANAIELAEVLDISLRRDKFFASTHPKFAPLETNVSGIFVCGAAQGPTDISETINQALAVVSKVAKVLGKGEVRVKLSKAVVNENYCIGCRVCEISCPFNAAKVSVQGISNVVEVMCKECGICAAECPAEAIQLVNYRDEQLNEIIKGVLSS